MKTLFNKHCNFKVIWKKNIVFSDDIGLGYYIKNLKGVNPKLENLVVVKSCLIF